jgi:DNA polymerase (family 10)
MILRWVVRNREIAAVFDRIADLLQIRGDAIYRVLAYRRAAESLGSLSRNVTDLWEEEELESIQRVGTAIADKIDELLSTNKMTFYEKLIEEIPETLPDLLMVGDVGPKKVALFWKELGITSVADLEKAAKNGKLQKLPGMGPKSETKILENIEAFKRRQDSRPSIGSILPVAESFTARIGKIPGVVSVESAGSLRRWRDTIGDLDLVVSTKDKEKVMEEITNFPEIERIRGKGETKTSVELVDGLRVQLWAHPPDRFGTALQYATGSQAHNVRLREYALDQGLSLSEHGFKREDGSEILCSKESDVYEVLGLPWIPPEIREGSGEVEAAIEDQLPKLIQMKQLKGELHAHSDWSDGKASMKVMVEAAIERRLTYLIFTDHSRSLGIANGLSIERLREQRKEIDKLQKRFGDQIQLFQGSEVEILADGTLDYPDDVLEELDFVIASLHSALRQEREKVTARVLGAIENPHIDLIAHLSGRLIGRREGADLDYDQILQAAAKNGTILEINAHPDRLDIIDFHARRALDLGVLTAVSTDAHSPDDFDLRIYGIGIARRAWATSNSVVNAWSKTKFTRWLKKRNK